MTWTSEAAPFEYVFLQIVRREASQELPRLSKTERDPCQGLHSTTRFDLASDPIQCSQPYLKSNIVQRNFISSCAHRLW